MASALRLPNIASAAFCMHAFTSSRKVSFSGFARTTAS